MKHIVLILFCGVFLTTSLLGQSKYGAFGELIDDFGVVEISTISKNSIPGTRNKANTTKGDAIKQKDENGQIRYLTFKIEILTTRSPLDLNHPIFELYGNITFNQSSDEGFAYFTGEFDSEMEANLFLKEYVANKYPKARIVKERRFIK